MNVYDIYVYTCITSTFVYLHTYSHICVFSIPHIYVYDYIYIYFLYVGFICQCILF